MAVSNDTPKTNKNSWGLFDPERYTSMLTGGSYAQNPVGFMDWFEGRYGPNAPAASSASANTARNQWWTNAPGSYEQYQKLMDDVFNQSGFSRASGSDPSKFTYFNPTTNQTVDRNNPFYQYNQTYNYGGVNAAPTLAELQNTAAGGSSAPLPTDVAGLLSYIDQGGDPTRLGMQQFFRIAMGENQRAGESGKARIESDFDRLGKQVAAREAAKGNLGTPMYDLAAGATQAQKQQAMLDLEEAIRSGNVGMVNSYSTDTANRLQQAQADTRSASEAAANRQFTLDMANAQVPMQLFSLLANLENQRIATNANTTGQHLATMNSFNFGYPTGFPEMMQQYGAGGAAENLYGDARGKNGLGLGFLVGALGSLIPGFGGGYAATY